MVFAVCLDGTSPGLEFWNALSVGEQAKILTIFTYLAEQGVCTNRKKFKQIEGTDFFEFKSHQVRMPCWFTPGRLVIISHGFRKQQDRIPKPQLERAQRIRKEDELAHERDPHSKEWRKGAGGS